MNNIENNSRNKHFSNSLNNLGKKLAPFIGPRPFSRDLQDQQRFFGRDSETDEIVSLISSHKLVLIYAQSGAGKTSIFEAKVVPILEKEYKFNVLPTARVDITSYTKSDFNTNESVSQFKNFYMLNTFQSLKPDIKSSEFLKTSLSEFLKSQFPSPKDENGNFIPQVVIFDQFEQFFTFYPDNSWKKQREDFFNQVAKALEDIKPLQIVFIIREDYLAELDPFVDILPERLRPRFRLEPLNKDAAYLAISEPLEKIGKRNIDERLIEKLHERKVIDKLIEDLSKIKKETFRGRSFELKGEFVDSLQLQVVCKRLWEKLQITQIDQINDPNYFDFLGDVDKALEDYYDDAIKTAASRTRISQDEIRNWIETSLITSSGTRGTVYREFEKTGGIPNEAIQILGEKYLITIQNRLGGHWYELTHDRLIRPIKDSNRKHKQSDLDNEMKSWGNEIYIDSGVEKLIKGKLDSEGKSKSEKKLSIEVTEVVKKIDQLKEKLRNIIEIESEHPLPFDIEESLRSANLLYYDGNYEESIKYLNNVIEINPNDVHAWVNKGLAFNALLKYDEALTSFDKALEIDLNYAEAWNGKGLVYSYLKRYDESLLCYDKALEIDPKYVDAWSNKGIVYYYLKRYDESLLCYDKALEIDPKYVGALNLKGIAYKNLKRYDEALQYYDKALTIDPSNVNALNGKANVLSEQQRYDEAIEYYDKALTIDPSNVNTLNGKANVLSEPQRYDEAIEYYDKALAIDPSNVNALNGKANVLSALGNYSEAIVYYDKALTIDPLNVNTLNGKGAVLNILGYLEIAITLYDKALAIDPSNVDALNSKAFALANLDKNEEALLLIHKALETNPDNEYYLNTAAFIMYNLGKIEEAKAYYEKALKINPNLNSILTDKELTAFNKIMNNE